MKFQKDLPLATLLVSLFLAGCTTAALVGVGAGAGIGTYSYVTGELTMDYPYALDPTWNACLTALERLDIGVKTRQKDALGGEITGRRGDGKPVVIRIRDNGLRVTEVRVRVGTFGDQEASRKIHQTLRNMLEG